jgi:hypothetical protein
MIHSISPLKPTNKLNVKHTFIGNNQIFLSAHNIDQVKMSGLLYMRLIEELCLIGPFIWLMGSVLMQQKILCMKLDS